MQQLQRKNVSSLLEAIPGVQSSQQLRNTKMEAGKNLVTWPNLEPPVLQSS